LCDICTGATEVTFSFATPKHRQFHTYLTGERSLARVNQHVPTQNVRLLELHTALAACVVLVTSMLPLVLIQARHVLKLLTTHFAHVRAMHLHTAAPLVTNLTSPT